MNALSSHSMSSFVNNFSFSPYRSHKKKQAWKVFNWTYQLYYGKEDVAKLYSCKALFTTVKSLLWPQPIHIVFANMNQCLEVWPSSFVKSISTCIRKPIFSHLLFNWWVTFTYVKFSLISATVSSGQMCISQRFEEVSFWKTNSSVLVMNFSLLQSPLFLLDSCIIFLPYWL